ncbi:MAG TPA: alanine--tRNA ligase-related protein [Candidatus Paceibacterota bacterium]
MTVAEVRKKYLDFFKSKGHVIVPSASLVPENDPTTLFTGSGMQPMLSYLLGQKHPLGRRIANSQKCFRAQDIEEVGDNRHTTFFEMLGNWSLGDPSTGVRAGYWKEEQLSWIFEFLTKELKIPTGKLWVTCFEGDEKLGLPKDTESSELWERIGIPKDHILFYGVEKNWWSRTGAPEKMPVGEPGGPDSEIFYEFTQIPHDKKFGEECHPNCDCGRFMEIGNSVFMEYRRIGEGRNTTTPPYGHPSSTEEGRRGNAVFEKLPQRNVDFGGGLERITAAVNDEPDIFKLDVFAEKIRGWEKESERSYSDESNQRAFRIVADHTRAAEMLAADGVTPSNLGQGYVLRRLLRRAIFYADRLGIKLGEQFREEEEKFRRTLEKGHKIIESPEWWGVPDEPPPEKGGSFAGHAEPFLSGKRVFDLHQTYGFPFELTCEIAREKGVSIDEKGLKAEIDRHQEISRAGVEKKFKGGLADTSEMSVKYHTATHLLHQALRDVLGSEVRQRGSNITPERLRFDFAFPRKMTEQEKKKVEEIVNEKIKAILPVHKVTLPLTEAKKSGARHFFDEKYPDEVLVHYIGDSLETAYSKEFCGGPHVAHTGALGGGFRIVKEEAVSAGVRRIKATLTNN